MDGYVLEFGSGIAGYAIFVPYNPRNRRSRVNAMNQPLGPEGPKRPPAASWRKGDKVNIPGVGRGEVIKPGSAVSRVKVGDMVPCDIPTRVLQKVPPKKKSGMLGSTPRRRIFDYGTWGFTGLGG